MNTEAFKRYDELLAALRAAEHALTMIVAVAPGTDVEKYAQSALTRDIAPAIAKATDTSP